MAHKKSIPHVHEAKGDHSVARAHARHAWEQIEAGHYQLENVNEEDLGNGRVRISFERVETNPDHVAEHHGL